MEPVDPIVPLARLINSTPGECRARGIRWWLSRTLDMRNAIQSIEAIREASGIGLGDAKGLCAGVAAEPARMEDVLTRLLRGDVTNAALWLRHHYHLGSSSDPHASMRVALALARAFELPWIETDAEIIPPPEPELETFADAAGWSVEATRERGLVAWLEGMMPAEPTVAVLVAARSASGLALRPAVDLLRVLRADAQLARRSIETPDSPALGALDVELAAHAGCEAHEAHDLVRAFRRAFGGRSERV
jgi:hypothetical protein